MRDNTGSLIERAAAGCPTCGSAGSHSPALSDQIEFVMFACGSFIDDAGSFEEPLTNVVGELNPCQRIAELRKALTALAGRLEVEGFVGHEECLVPEKSNTCEVCLALDVAHGVKHRCEGCAEAREEPGVCNDLCRQLAEQWAENDPFAREAGRVE